MSFYSFESFCEQDEETSEGNQAGTRHHSSTQTGPNRLWSSFILCFPLAIEYQESSHSPLLEKSIEAVTSEVSLHSSDVFNVHSSQCCFLTSPDMNHSCSAQSNEPFPHKLHGKSMEVVILMVSWFCSSNMQSHFEFSRDLLTCKYSALYLCYHTASRPKHFLFHFLQQQSRTTWCWNIPWLPLSHNSALT